MKKFLGILLIAILLTGEAVAHPIDDVEQSCIEMSKGQTQEMNKCSKYAQRAWKNELEKSLVELRMVLDKQTYKSILKSQKLWEKYYSSELKTFSIILNNTDGTMFYNVQSGVKTQLIKDRVEILNSYKSTIKF